MYCAVLPSYDSGKNADKDGAVKADNPKNRERIKEVLGIN